MILAAASGLRSSGTGLPGPEIAGWAEATAGVEAWEPVGIEPV